MTRYKFTIEYRTQDGQRRRTVYFGDMNGLRWFRREQVYDDGQWVRQSHVHITAPTVEIVPIGSGSFAGP